MTEIRTYEEAYVAIVGRHSEAQARPEDLAAVRLAAERSQILTEQGWEEREWRPCRGRPLAKYNGAGRFWEWDGHPHWLDHPYRLVNKAKGREVFVAEPYGITGDDLESLLKLETEGWDVIIDAGMALHFPGWTIAIWLERPKAPLRRGRQPDDP